MGWTSYQATHYKKGKVDRKAECDALFNCSDERRECAVLKSAMVGSTYYAAVKCTADEYSSVGAVVCLTSTDRKDYFNFSYKDMDETMGPFKYDCPKGILDLLTPTDNECANNWREACREMLAKKNNPNALNKLPVGTIIQVTMPFDTTYFSEGEVVKLRKDKNWRSNRTSWYVVQRAIKFTAGLMRQLEGCCEIIKRGEE